MLDSNGLYTKSQLTISYGVALHLHVYLLSVMIWRTSWKVTDSSLVTLIITCNPISFGTQSQR